jgi:hypothetical protein
VDSNRLTKIETAKALKAAGNFWIVVRDYFLEDQ